MSFLWYYDPNYKAPFRSDYVEESCVLAHNYFSTLADYFVEKLPEHRLPLESDAAQSTMADKVYLIFPNGFGDYDVEKNHNPRVWPAFIELANAVANGTTEDFADEICESWENFNADGQCKDQIQLLQRIFDYLTCYLQLFVVLSDGDSINPDFKYPPEDAGGVLLGSIFRKCEYRCEYPGSPA